MRFLILAAACGVACSACATLDPLNSPVLVPLPDGPAVARAGEPLERGRPVTLLPEQQKAVVIGVSRWLKNSRSALFGAMRAARDSRGVTVVCGWVSGRNHAGRLRGPAPYVGLLGGPGGSTFITVGIGDLRSDRVQVLSLCAETGAALAE